MYLLVVSECSPRIEVRGGGAAKQNVPGIFKNYKIEPDLVNGRLHYTSQDGKFAVAFNNVKNQWVIQPVAYR